jgi:hypothetical protein
VVKGIVGPVAFSCALFAAPPAYAQIVTENAGIISPETPILRESATFLQTDNAKELRWNNQAIIALPWRQEFKLTVPVVFRAVVPPRGDPEGNLFGSGDVSLRFKQSIWQDDDVLASTRLAAIVEATAPTGSDDTKDGGVAFARGLQLGTGAFGFGGGGAFTIIRDRHRLALEVFFRHTLRHDGVRLGETLDWNVAYWFRIEPATFSPDTDDVEVRGVIELLSSYRFQGKVGHNSSHDDGVLLWVAPGVQVYPLIWLLLEANVQLPLYQDIHDGFGRRRFATTVAIKLLF